MKHICFYYYHINIIGGVEIAILNLIKLLSKEYKITIAYSKQDSSLDMLLRLNKYADIVNVEYQKIACDTAVFCSIYCETPKNIKANKYVRWLHGNLKEIGYNLTKEDFINDYVTVGKECQKQLKEVTGVESNLIYNELDPEIHKKAKETINIIKKPLTLVTVSRISIEKGFERMLKLARLLKEKKIDYIWYIIGCSYDKAYEAKIKDTSPKEFIYLGKLDNPFPYMKESDFLVQLSSYESQGLSVTESLVLGTPVIVTKWKAVNEVVTDKVNGYILDMDFNDIPELQKLVFRYEYKNNYERWKEIL